jgi:tetratricopeptide (TPR) repeat protein
MTPADQHHRDGVARADRGDHKGAIRDYTKALKLDPDRADILNDRGISRKALGDPLAAMSDYAAALEVDPGYWQARANRGTLLAQQGEYGGAIFEYSLGLRVNPKSAQLYCFRANSLGSVMDYEGALRDYTKAVRLDPKMGDAWFGRGGTHQVLATLAGAGGEVLFEGWSSRPSRAAARRHLESARADFRKARELATPRSGYLHDLPRLLREAEADLRRARSK